MNRLRSTCRMSTGAAALLAVTGLALAGCSSGSSSSVPAAPPLAAGTAAAGSPNGSAFTGTQLFPVKVGDTWVYKVATGGLPVGTATDKIIAVVPVTGGDQVTTMHQLTGAASSSAKETLLFGSDGSITMPLTSLGNGTFKISSGGIVWPSQAQIDSGRPFTSTITATVTVAGQSHNVSTHVTVRGGGTATVRVPAGTYQATVVNDKLAEKFAGISVSIRIRTWMVRGIGPVKSQVTTNGATVSGRS